MFKEWNRQDGVETETTYEYDNLDRHNFPVNKTVTNSQNDLYETQTKYPYDFSGLAMTALLDQNRILPIETLQKVNGATVDGNWQEYDFIDATGAIGGGTGVESGPYPVKFNRYKVTWDGNGATQDIGWDLEGEVLQYSTFGRPKIFKKRGWNSETYLWNSNGTLDKKIFEDFEWDYEYHMGTKLIKRLQILTDYSLLMDSMNYLDSAIVLQEMVHSKAIIYIITKVVLAISILSLLTKHFRKIQMDYLNYLLKAVSSI